MTTKEIIRAQQYLKSLGDNHKRGKLWRAMRIMRAFNCKELMAVCELENIDSVRTYISMLRRVGYLRMTRTGLIRTYRLVRNTGPKPPQLMRGRTIFYDPNTQQEFPYVQNT